MLRKRRKGLDAGGYLPGGVRPTGRVSARLDRMSAKPKGRKQALAGYKSSTPHWSPELWAQCLPLAASVAEHSANLISIDDQKCFRAEAGAYRADFSLASSFVYRRTRA